MEAGHGGLDPVEALAGADVEGLAILAAELDVRRVFGSGNHLEDLPLGGEDTNAGLGARAGSGDDPAVGGDGHAVDAALIAEVVDHARIRHLPPVADPG